MKRKISITFNGREDTRPFERLERYLERKIQGMLKSFTIRRNKNILIRIFGYKYCAELLWLVWAIFGLFYLVLAYSSLMRLVIGSSTFYIKRKRRIDYAKNLKHAKKWRRARREKMKALKTMRVSLITTKPKTIIDLGKDLPIFSAISNVDLENLNLSIIANIKDLLAPLTQHIRELR